MTVSRQGKSSWLLPVILGLIFCALSIVIIAAVVLLPQNAQTRFGAPDSSLSWWNKLIYSAQLLAHEQELTEPAVAGDEPADFTIDYGENASMVATKLYEEGLIHSADSFRLFLSYSGLDRTIQAGEYQFKPGINALDIARQIQDATPAEVPFSILAGWRLEEIARALPTSGLSIDPDEFLAYVHNPAATGLTLPPGWKKSDSLEGLFFPGLYTISRETTLDLFVAYIISNFDSVVRNELEDKFTHQGLSFREGIILASMVEKEAVVADEQPMIASVFLNRLQSGMKLESDPTVQYAVGYDSKNETWWKNPLMVNDLEFDSPYNTYLYPGLPPGPICSPSLSAIQAVIAPAQTEYLYFRATCDGSGKHNFSYTYEEHLQNACE